MDTIAFPIKFENNRLVTHAQGTDQYYNQFISIALQTQPGEYPLDIDFGIKDMTFTDMADAAIKQTLSFYYKELSVDSVRIAQDVQTSNFVVDVFYTY